MKNTFAIIGGDKRQSYLTDMLSDEGFSVCPFGNPFAPCTDSLDLALENADILLLPFPVSPDGVYLNSSEKCEIPLDELFIKAKKHGIKHVFGGAIKPAVAEKAEKLGLKITDYGKNESLLLGNALCTAEGAIEIAMREIPITLHGSRVIILGYGRIGKMLATKIRSLGADVAAVARKPSDRTLMECDGIKAFSFTELSSALKNADLIYNTVPSQVIDKDVLSYIDRDALIIDLASSPGGVDVNAAKEAGVRVIWALSLPGKTCPKSAARIIKQAVLAELYAEKSTLV